MSDISRTFGILVDNFCEDFKGYGFLSEEGKNSLVEKRTSEIKTFLEESEYIFDKRLFEEDILELRRISDEMNYSAIKSQIDQSLLVPTLSQLTLLLRISLLEKLSEQKISRELIEIKPIDDYASPCEFMVVIKRKDLHIAPLWIGYEPESEWPSVKITSKYKSSGGTCFITWRECEVLEVFDEIIKHANGLLIF
jgi:hypothetical protein